MKALDGMDEGTRELIIPMIDDYIFVQKRLDELKKFPPIETHPKNPSKQRRTAAGMHCKEYLQLKSNIFKSLCMMLKRIETETDSPLREYLKSIEVRG